MPILRRFNDRDCLRTWVRRWKLLWVFSLVAGCWLGRAYASDCPHCPAPGAMDPEAQAEVLQQADDIFKEVSRLRGLPIKNPVAKKFADKAFFREYYSRLLNEQYPPEKKRAAEKAYALLGFLPGGTDLIQTYLDSFLSVAQGLYDPESKTLYIADWIDPDKLEGTLAHELDHALQDQYFDLGDFLKKGQDLSMDAQFARTSVMEGEAAAIALNYSLEDKGSDFTQLVNIADWVRQTNLMEEAGQKAFGRKAVLNEAINFPYVYGSAFLQKYIKIFGWNGMESLFQRPPTSTHQIMHPEVFFPRREKTTKVSIDDLSKDVLKDYALIWENTLGEYGLSLLLRQFVPGPEAFRSVRGWRGDRIQVYETKDRRRSALVGYMVFADAGSAEDFFESYQTLLRGKYKMEGIRRLDDTIYWSILEGGEMEAYLERFGKRVIFMEGTRPSDTSKVRAALWNVIPAKAK